MQIAALLHENPLVLAPLAGYSDLPFRLLCRRFGAGLCYTEMVSCHGLVYDRQKTVQLTRSVPEERPVALQLFGADPEKMGKAAAIASEMGIDIIDINMGCPVKNVLRKAIFGTSARMRLMRSIVIIAVV